MDKLVYDTVVGNTVVQDECGERVYSSNSLGVSDDPLEHPRVPFVAINQLPSASFQEVKETSNATSHAFSIYVYDELGDGTRIDRILNSLRDDFKQLSGTHSASGAFCLDVEWQGTSGLVSDREYSTNVKFCTIRLVANQ